MKIMVVLKNPRSGELRKIKVGFSWTLLGFSCFGIPLFMRGHYVWGISMLLLWGASFFFVPAVAIEMLLWFYLGFKGNEMTAKMLLDKSWTFEPMDSDDVRWAKKTWGLSLDSIPLAKA